MIWHRFHEGWVYDIFNEILVEHDIVSAHFRAFYAQLPAAQIFKDRDLHGRMLYDSRLLVFSFMTRREQHMYIISFGFAKEDRFYECKQWLLVCHAQKVATASTT